MCRLFWAVVMLGISGSVCFAQTSPAPVHHWKHHITEHTERPTDKGPYTPEANAAYQGGGVVLQGAPGGPAPRPEPTAPGEVPRNAVPQTR